jgi:hypothetical protein
MYIMAKSKVFPRIDVLGGDLVDARLDGDDELFLVALLLLGIIRVYQAREALQRELGVHGHDPLAQDDGSVHLRPVLKLCLIL